ncbi:MAG: hypothetical protein ACK4N5_20230 [Myxococcales bacterium]
MHRLLAGVLVALAFTGPARAEQAPAERDSAAAESNRRYGDLNVMLKGGIGSFTGGLNEFTSAGPSWGAVLNLQPTRVLGFEVAYEGSHHAMPGLGNAALLRNGGSAMLKLGPPLIDRYRPFVATGLGASFVRPQGADAAIAESDLMQEVPLVAGFEFNTRRVTAGVRASYRYLVDEQFLRPVGNPQGGMFDTSVTVGGRF